MGQNDKDEVFTLKLDSIPSVTTNLKLIICASAPSTGDPKVFVKYYCVNTATCEKSGEMLGVATFTESE